MKHRKRVKTEVLGFRLGSHYRRGLPREVIPAVIESGLCKARSQASSAKQRGRQKAIHESLSESWQTSLQSLPKI
jgi:hypothetical protein